MIKCFAELFTKPLTSYSAFAGRGVKANTVVIFNTGKDKNKCLK